MTEVCVVVTAKKILDFPRGSNPLVLFLGNFPPSDSRLARAQEIDPGAVRAQQLQKCVKNRHFDYEDIKNYDISIKI